LLTSPILWQYRASTTLRCKVTKKVLRAVLPKTKWKWQSKGTNTTNYP